MNRCLWIYALLLVSLTTLAWGVYFGGGRAALQRPLFRSADRFRDLTNFTWKIAHLGDGASVMGSGYPTFSYPAPATYVFAFWLRTFPHHPALAYLLFLVASIFFAMVVLWRITQAGRPVNYGLRAAIVATGLLGFPLIFTADRANMEAVVTLVLGIGLALFASEKNYASAIFIGLSACIKPFPVIFLLLLVRKRRYREVATGIAVAAGTVLLVLTTLGPTPIEAYQGLRPGVQLYFNSYVVTLRSLDEHRFEHSIMDTLKSVASGWSDLKMVAEKVPVRKPQADKSSDQTLGASLESQATPDRTTYSKAAILGVIFALSLVLDAIGLGFVLIRVFQLPVVNQMILLGVSATLFPFVASEYTLLYLYVPFGIFLIFLTRDVATGFVEFSRRRILGFLCLFALLFAPLSFTGRYLGSIQTVLLVVLLLAAARIPMPSSLFREMPVADEVSLVDAGRL